MGMDREGSASSCFVVTLEHMRDVNDLVVDANKGTLGTWVREVKDGCIPLVEAPSPESTRRLALIFSRDRGHGSALGRSFRFDFMITICAQKYSNAPMINPIAAFFVNPHC